MFARRSAQTLKYGHPMKSERVKERVGQSGHTSICVAIPAWSVPGNQSVGLPLILWNLAKMSWIATNIAWPICSRPVTLGGGIGIVNEGFLIDSDETAGAFGLKYPSASHHLYKFSSMALKSYWVDNCPSSPRGAKGLTGFPEDEVNDIGYWDILREKRKEKMECECKFKQST